MVPRSAGGLRRRDVVRHGVGALALAALAPIARSAAALGAAAPASPERVCASLLEAVADAPSLRLSPAAVAGATERFAALAPARRVGLAALERAPGRPFSALSAGERRRFLAAAATEHPLLAERIHGLLAAVLHGDDEDGMARVPVSV
jgi:hypothetical protein